MRAKYLCGLAVVLTGVACRAPQAEPEPATATRAEVNEALRMQLRLVRARYDELNSNETPAAQNEKEILLELAIGITLKIMRIDPEARLDHTSIPRSRGGIAAGY
jgi:hypothetical protein